MQEINLKQLFKKNRWLALKIQQQGLIAKVLRKIRKDLFLLKASNLGSIPKNELTEIECKNSLLAVKTEGYIEDSAKDGEFELEVNETGKILWERDHIRINIYQNTRFEIVNRPFFKQKKFPVLIEDISASGAKLIVEMPLNEGYIINLNMEFADFSFTNLRAEVVRKNKICKLKTRVYEAGVKFIHLQKERKELINYINQQQIKLKMF